MHDHHPNKQDDTLRIVDRTFGIVALCSTFQLLLKLKVE